jgi:tetratricopeptide (TPR) repeat protein
MLARLERRLSLLVSGNRDLDERQQTLRATVEWSYDLLSEQERTIFARLGVFVGGCRIDAAESVCDPDDDLGMDVFDGVASLVEKSLLRQRDDPDGEPRFWMLETIREYALDRLSARSERDRAEEALAQQVIAFSLEARRKSRLDEASAWLARLDAEHHNIRFVLDWLIARDRGDDAANVLAGIWFFWLSRGHAREGISLAERTTDLHYSTPLLRGQALVLTGELLSGQGRWSQARPLKQQALTIFLDQGDESEAAATLSDLGVIAAAEGDLAQARELHTRSLALRETLGEPHGIAHALSGVADLELQEGNYQVARPLLYRIIEISRQTGAGQILCSGLADLGELERREGNLLAAMSLLREALTAVQETGDLYLIQLILDCIARVIGELGRANDAAQLWGASEAIREKGGFVLWERRHYDEAVGATSQQLAEQDFRRAWDAGRLLSIEQSIEAALQPR